MQFWVPFTAWTPIAGRFKDYIAMPKANGYQSYATVIGPEGRFRWSCHITCADFAEYGVAAHWAYKEGKTGRVQENLDDQKLNVILKEILEMRVKSRR